MVAIVEIIAEIRHFPVALYTSRKRTTARSFVRICSIFSINSIIGNGRYLIFITWNRSDCCLCKRRRHLSHPQHNIFPSQKGSRRLMCASTRERNAPTSYCTTPVSQGLVPSKNLHCFSPIGLRRRQQVVSG